MLVCRRTLLPVPRGRVADQLLRFPRLPLYLRVEGGWGGFRVGWFLRGDLAVPVRADGVFELLPPAAEADGRVVGPLLLLPRCPAMVVPVACTLRKLGREGNGGGTWGGERWVGGGVEGRGRKGSVVVCKGALSRKSILA